MGNISAKVDIGLGIPDLGRPIGVRRRALPATKGWPPRAFLFSYLLRVDPGPLAVLSVPHSDKESDRPLDLYREYRWHQLPTTRSLCSLLERIAFAVGIIGGGDRHVGLRLWAAFDGLPNIARDHRSVGSHRPFTVRHSIRWLPE